MEQPSWTFEPLSTDTHDAVRSLILAGLAEHWGELDPTMNPDLDDLFESYATGVTIVARIGKKVVGTGTLMPRSATTAEILRMSVASDLRRAGLGRAIVNRLTDDAKQKGFSEVILETTSAWTDVVAFYVSCGFVITHIEPSPFGDDTWFRKDLAD